MFGAENVHGCYGFQTQEYRMSHDIGKDHPEDAVCISALGCGLDQITDVTTAHEVQQFRRHDRQLVKAQRERTYKLDGKTVAKNRRPRSEQPKDCPALSVWYEQRIKVAGGRQADVELSRLSVKRSTRYYNSPHRILPGAVFIYQGRRYVMNSQFSRGVYYRAYGEGSINYPAKDVAVVRKNAGLVFVG